MNINENIHNKKIFYCSTFISYIIRYIYFIKPENDIKNKNNSLKSYHIDQN